MSDHPIISEFPDEEEERTAVIHVADLRRSSMPARPDRHVLIRMDSAHIGRVFTLDQAEYLLGRHPSCSMVIADEGVSRRHARILRVDGGFVLEDLGSANGTFMGDDRVSERRLRDGDVFQLGPTVIFRYAFTDLSQERMLQQLYEASVKDALTGAYNRDHFEERLKMEVAYAARHAALLSLVMFDLDHFKTVNDAYGHTAGDTVLRAAAARVTQKLRTEDIFARYGGEEFAVILRGIDRVGALAVGERIRDGIGEAPVVCDDISVPVTTSVGVASLECCPEKTPLALIATADRRLYLAKRSGRNRVVSEG